jgi:predicted metal-binding membrane protein
MPESQKLGAVFKRERAIVALVLVGIVGLSWAYLVYMDWGMRHMDFGMDMVIMPAMQHWTARELLLVFLMWTIMMVAMMVPSASPAIIIFAEINRRRREQRAPIERTIPPRPCFHRVGYVGCFWIAEITSI